MHLELLLFYISEASCRLLIIKSKGKRKVDWKCPPKSQFHAYFIEMDSFLKARVCDLYVILSLLGIQLNMHTRNIGVCFEM